MNATGKIIVLAYPDTFVTMSDEWICKVLPLVGLGTREFIKAGHAALVLIENRTGIAQYFDFGRYVTPKGHGRVRGANTDVELEIPFKAEFGANGQLVNLEAFLLWLDANPDKTHGQGRLIASVCQGIDYARANDFIYALQNRGSIPYGAFHSDGSNCSRFVTDTILASTSDRKIIRALRFNKLFTPSTVGNVEKAAFNGVYEVFEGQVSPFKGTAFKENLKNYFDKKRPASSYAANGSLPQSAQKLSGTGSNAWFDISTDGLPEGHYRIRRYNDLHKIDHDGVYTVKGKLDLSMPYQFTYDSHCTRCHVIQDGQMVRLEKIALYREFSSSRKVRSA